MPALATDRRFWDRIADRYAARPISDEAAWRRKLAMTQARMRPEMSVLEIGCGTGGAALEHAPHVGQILGTDIAPRMIEIARARAEAAGVSNVRFEVAAVEDLDLPDGSLDMVLALNLLHLLEDRPAALARIRRMLKPGGVLVASTACLGDSVLRWLGLVLPIGRMLGKLPRVGIFTSARLEREFADAGFEVEERWQPGPRTALFTIARAV